MKKLKQFISALVVIAVLMSALGMTAWGYKVGEFEIKDGVLGYYYGHEAVITIPAEWGVKEIGSNPFSGRQFLTSITLPSTVLVIGDNAFINDMSLTTVNMQNVTSIGKFAFDGCSNLPEITLPDTLASIGVAAFRGCANLTSIVLPEGITAIPINGFSNCSKLEKVTLPGTLTLVDAEAFSNCSSLTSVVIPDGVTTLGGFAFEGCTNLTSITIPASVATMTTGTFLYDDKLTIYGYDGSYAEKFANENMIPFVSLSGKSTSPAPGASASETADATETVSAPAAASASDDAAAPSQKASGISTFLAVIGNALVSFFKFIFKFFF